MDERFMKMALEEAQSAFALGEVPVGAVITQGGKVLVRTHNLCEAALDPTAHAEVLAIREAARVMDGRLDGCTLYCTLEPCVMCAGAAILARISRIVFGAFDVQMGCCGSVADVTDHWFNHSIEVIGGVMERACASILREFFEQRR